MNMNPLEKLTVNDLYLEGMSLPIIVRADENLTQVIRQFTEFPEARGIVVVDENDRLLGVFTRRDLLDWARVKIGINSDSGKLWLTEESRLLKILMSFAAGDLISPESRQAGIRLKDSLSRALQLMVDLDLICLPVLDDGGQIIGDLKLMQILSSVVREEQKKFSNHLES